MEPANGTIKNYVHSGAKMVFNQIYSNGSEVSYRMSHIEGLTETPGQISPENIIEKILAFLEEVVQYEK